MRALLHGLLIDVLRIVRPSVVGQGVPERGEALKFTVFVGSDDAGVLPRVEN